MALSVEQRARIEARHKHSISRYGYDASALFWSSREIQEVRFQVILNAIASLSSSANQLSVLDVGCGFGDFNAYAQDQACAFDYLGIDVASEMVNASQRKYPGIKTLHGEIFDFNWPDETFDWVILSGALNEVVDKTGEHARSVIERMFQVAKKGVVFNVLNQHEPWIKSRPDLQSFLPEKMIAYCETLANEVMLVDDYLPNDFTVMLLKKEDV